MKRNNKCYMPKAEWMEEEMLLVFLNSIRFVFGGENWTIWKNHLIFFRLFFRFRFVCSSLIAFEIVYACDCARIKMNS